MRAFHPVSSPMPVARFLFPHASDIFPPSSNVCCRLLFAAIVLLLLWAPVLVPSLPSALQHLFQPSISPPPIPSLLLSHGLYVATLLLVRVWGRQVRRFPSPFRAYGLNLLGSQREVSHPRHMRSAMLWWGQAREPESPSGGYLNSTVLCGRIHASECM